MKHFLPKLLEVGLGSAAGMEVGKLVPAEGPPTALGAFLLVGEPDELVLGGRHVSQQVGQQALGLETSRRQNVGGWQTVGRGGRSWFGVLVVPRPGEEHHRQVQKQNFG